MDKIEKIRKEIERRLKNAEYEMAVARGISHDNFIIHQAESNLCRFLLDFIDTLQQEQQEVDLEKELDKYLRGEFQQTAGGNFNNYIQVARHFAEWGADQLRESTKMVDKDLEGAAAQYGYTYSADWPGQVPAAREGFIAGAKWKEAQMTRGAVEGEIQMRYSGSLCAKTICAINEDKFELGDKVKLIIIKEDADKDFHNH